MLKFHTRTRRLNNESRLFGVSELQQTAYMAIQLTSEDSQTHPPDSRAIFEDGK